MTFRSDVLQGPTPGTNTTSEARLLRPSRRACHVQGPDPSEPPQRFPPPAPAALTPPAQSLFFKIRRGNQLEVAIDPNRGAPKRSLPSSASASPTAGVVGSRHGRDCVRSWPGVPLQ